MQAAKPFYDVDFWEEVYAKEKMAYDTLLTQKAKRLKALKDKDLFTLPESEAMKTQKLIGFLSRELNTLYGFKLFTNEMQACYLDSIDKIYDAYHDKNLALEMELARMRYEYRLLLENYLQSIDEAANWLHLFYKNKKLPTK